MSFSRFTSFSLKPSVLMALLSALVPACGSPVDATSAGTSASGGSGGGTGAAGGTGGAGGSTGGAGGTGATGGGSNDCPQATTMLDVSKAPGAGASYPKPTLTAMCTADKFVVESNDIPHYTFVQTTPNPLKGQNEHFEIPRNPQIAAQTTAIPLLGVVGFAVNGMPFFGPNEAAQPADEAYGDPIYNGLMDPCLGHTSPGEYHYHSMLVKCLDQNSLVEKPWMNADPAADKASPIIAWSLDGFPIYGPLECKDKGCGSVIELKSGYDKIGDPKTHAWDAYKWQAHDGDAAYLDECNGHTGPNGDYHYHATAGFPYIQGCYKGTAGGGSMGGAGGAGGTGGQGGAGGAGGQGGTGGSMMGPKSCTMQSDCNGACPPGSKGCSCNDSPMGKICVPTCTTTADCPSGGGMTLTCNGGICVPQ